MSEQEVDIVFRDSEDDDTEDKIDKLKTNETCTITFSNVSKIMLECNK